MVLEHPPERLRVRATQRHRGIDRRETSMLALRQLVVELTWSRAHCCCSSSACLACLDCSLLAFVTGALATSRLEHAIVKVLQAVRFELVGWLRRISWSGACKYGVSACGLYNVSELKVEVAAATDFI